MYIDKYVCNVSVSIYMMNQSRTWQHGAARKVAVIPVMIFPELETKKEHQNWCAVQSDGQKVLEHLFNITRIWTYSLHRDRLKLLGRWRNFSKKWNYLYSTYDKSSNSKCVELHFHLQGDSKKNARILLPNKMAITPSIFKQSGFNFTWK